MADKLEQRVSEVTYSTIVANAVIGTCFAFQLLDTDQADRRRLLEFTSLFDSSLLGHSAKSLVQQTLVGADRGRLEYQRIPKAIIGLCRFGQLLDDDLPWKTKYELYQMCLSLIKAGTANGVVITESASRLMDSTFPEMTDIQDDPEYLALEPLFQASHGIGGCGGEHWDPSWDKK